MSQADHDAPTTSPRVDGSAAPADNAGDDAPAAGVSLAAFVDAPEPADVCIGPQVAPAKQLSLSVSASSSSSSATVDAGISLVSPPAAIPPVADAVPAPVPVKAPWGAHGPQLVSVPFARAQSLWPVQAQHDQPAPADGEPADGAESVFVVPAGLMRSQPLGTAVIEQPCAQQQSQQQHLAAPSDVQAGEEQPAAPVASPASTAGAGAGVVSPAPADNAAAGTSVWSRALASAATAVGAVAAAAASAVNHGGDTAAATTGAAAADTAAPAPADASTTTTTSTTVTLTAPALTPTSSNNGTTNTTSSISTSTSTAFGSTTPARSTADPLAAFTAPASASSGAGAGAGGGAGGSVWSRGMRSVKLFMMTHAGLFRHHAFSAAPLFLLGHRYDMRGFLPQHAAHLAAANNAGEPPASAQQSPAASPAAAESPAVVSLSAFLAHLHSVLWMSYRRGFPHIQTPSQPLVQGPTSDKGWGCMLRSAQMMLANVLVRHAFLQDPRAWAVAPRAASPPPPLLSVLHMFMDAPSAPLGVHALCRLGAAMLNKEPGEWFGPAETAQLLRRALSDAADALRLVEDRKRKAAEQQQQQQPAGAAAAAAADAALGSGLGTVIAPCVGTLAVELAEGNTVYLDRLVRAATGQELAHIDWGARRPPAQAQQQQQAHQQAQAQAQTPARAVDGSPVEGSPSPSPSASETDPAAAAAAVAAAAAGAGAGAAAAPAAAAAAPQAAGFEWRPLLLLVPVRLGLDRISDAYKTSLLQCFQIPQCAGAIGGRPRSSLFFVGAQETRLFFLDPHTVQDARVGEDRTLAGLARPGALRSYYTSQVQSIEVDALDPCLTLAFYLPSEDETMEFWQLAKQMAAASLSVLCVEDVAPVLGDARDDCCDYDDEEEEEEGGDGGGKKQSSKAASAADDKDEDGFVVI